jgi:hypothetical protein
MFTVKVGATITEVECELVELTAVTVVETEDRLRQVVAQLADLIAALRQQGMVVTQRPPEPLQ